MHRIDTPGNVGGLFVPPNPIIGQIPVVVDSAWLNDVQENIMAVLAAGAVAATKGDSADLTNAILALIAGHLGTHVVTFNTRSGAVVLDGADIDAAMALATNGLVQRTGAGTYVIVSPTKLLSVGDTVLSLGAARAGALLCDGSGFSGGTYPLLAAFLGGTVLPNMRDMVPKGAHAGIRAPGSLEAGGIEAHTHNAGMPFSTGSGPLDIYASTGAGVPGAASQRIHTDALSGGEVQAITSSTGGSANLVDNMAWNFWMIHD